MADGGLESRRMVWLETEMTPRFGVFFRFEERELRTEHFSESAAAYALENGWELVGWEPRSEADQIEATREAEEHKWDPLLLAKAMKTIRERRIRGWTE